MEKGAGGKAFSRQAVMTKFRKWLASKDLDALSDKRIMINSDDVPTVDSLMQTVEATDFFENCVNKFDLRASYDRKQDSIILHLQQLRSNSIESINQALQSTSAKDLARKSRLYHEKESANIESFVSQFTKLSICDDNPTSSSLGHLYASEFLRHLYFKLKTKSAKTLESRVDEVVESIIKDRNSVFFSDGESECIYYLAGWLLNSAKKIAPRRAQGGSLNKWLPILVDKNSVDSEPIKKTFPIRKVQAAASFSDLLYPSKQFYEFVCTVERICEAVLVTQSVILYGTSFLGDLKNKIFSIPLLCRHVLECLDEEASEILNESESELKKVIPDIIEYLVTKYLHMRGKDFVRKIMGRSRNAETTGTRPRLKVLGNSENYKHEDKKEKEEEIQDGANEGSGKEDETNDTVNVEEECTIMQETMDEIEKISMTMDEIDDDDEIIAIDDELSSSFPFSCLTEVVLA